MELNKYIFGVDETETFHKSLTKKALKEIKEFGVVIYDKEDLDIVVPMAVQQQILIIVDRKNKEMEQENGKKR